MSNVIKFQRLTKAMPPRQTPPWLRRLLIILGIAAALPACPPWFDVAGDQQIRCSEAGDSTYRLEFEDPPPK